MEFNFRKLFYQLSDLSKNHRYRIMQDHNDMLAVLDKKTNDLFLIHPVDIILKGLYKEMSHEDVLRVAFICGQMSRDD